MKKIIIALFTMMLVVLAIPLTPRAQTAVECEEEYVVQVGDTLAGIAEQTLNDPLAYPALVVLANAAPDDQYANIDDPNVVEEGWTVCIPSEEDLPDLLVEGGPIIQALARAAGIEPPPPLEETLWVLVGSGDPQDPTVVEPGTVVTAQFSETGALTGSGGCNNYTLSYEVDDDKNLAVRGPVGLTQRLCPIGNEQETAYLDALQKATNYQITADGFLLIEYKSGLVRSSTLIFVSGQAQLKNTQWVLQAYGNPEALQPIEPATTVTAVFTGQPNLNQGTIVGFGGCNSYSADYVVQDNRMIVRPPLGTLAFCEIGSDQESTYLALLGEAETFEIIGKQLTITGPNGVLVYSSANLPLEQVQWTLESFGGPAAQQPIPAGLDITALFVPNRDNEEEAEEGVSGTVSGSSGCNSYNASYQKELRQLSFGPALTTLMACPPDQADAELAFFAALETVERYQVLGDQLRLFYDGGEQVITFRANRTPLEETYWKLISYGKVDQLQLPVDGTEVTAVFEERPNAPSGVVAGSTGCNSYSSVYAASLTGVKVNPPINTLTFCAGTVGKVERAYLQGLAGATQYNIVGNALQIVYNDGKQALNFVASQPPIVPPTAVIEGPSRAQVGDTVTFSGSNSQGPESPIVQLSWDFGDGMTAEGPVVDHIYGIVGIYTVRLTVVDERGVSSSTTTQIEITDPPAEGPVAVIEGPTKALVGQDVTFQGGNSLAGNSPIVVYGWSIDQLVATPVGGSDVSYTTRFDQPGVYDVTLTVTDQNGLSDSADLRIEVFPREEPQTPPTAVIEGPTEAIVGQDVTFQGGNSIPGSTPIVVYAWGVNGIQPTTSAADVRFTTRFDQPGQYEVSLTVTDQNGLSDTSSLIINVSEEPPAEGPTAVIEGPAQAFVGEDVNFQGGNSIPGSSPIVVYGWGIDGPQPASSPDVSFTTRFNQAGVYNVTLTVTDQNGLSNSASLQISVQTTLEGATWMLSGTLPGTAITAQFDGANLSGSSGCNTYNGTYASTRAGGSSNNITVGELITTQLACEEAVMSQEQTYLAALSSAQSYTIQGNTLSIAYPGGTLTFQGEPR